MLALTQSTDETSHLAVLQGSDVIYLDKREPLKPGVRLVTEIGTRLPAHLTAVGRAILSRLDAEQISALYEGGYTWPTRTGTVRRRSPNCENCSPQHVRADMRSKRMRRHPDQLHRQPRDHTGRSSGRSSRRHLPLRLQIGRGECLIADRVRAVSAEFSADLGDRMVETPTADM